MVVTLFQRRLYLNPDMETSGLGFCKPTAGKNINQHPSDKMSLSLHIPKKHTK
jgi:hypothetical protein